MSDNRPVFTGPNGPYALHAPTCSYRDGLCNCGARPAAAVVSEREQARETALAEAWAEWWFPRESPAFEVVLPDIFTAGANWQAEQDAAALWTCPDCAFSFAAEHVNQDGGYTCPVCAETRLEAALRTCLAALLVFRGMPDPTSGPLRFPARAAIAQARAALGESA